MKHRARAHRIAGYKPNRLSFRLRRILRRIFRPVQSDEVAQAVADGQLAPNESAKRAARLALDARPNSTRRRDGDQESSLP